MWGGQARAKGSGALRRPEKSIIGRPLLLPILMHLPHSYHVTNASTIAATATVLVILVILGNVFFDAELSRGLKQTA